MAKIKPRRAFAKAKFSGFHGIRSDAAPLTERAEEIMNFRIRSDGTLEKRNGWNAWRAFNGTVKAFWQGTLEEEHYMFTVVQQSILKSTGEHSSAIVGNLSSGAKPTFFKYGEQLYLLNGTKIMVYRPSKDFFEEVQPYSPLYGYNWNPEVGGDIREPLNLLTKRIRVHYLNTSQNTSFSLPFFADTIDHVRVDNRAVYEYTLNSMCDSLTVPSASTASTVEIAFTIDFESDLSSSLLQSTLVHVFREKENETLFLSGSPHGYRVFCSSVIPKVMLTYASLFYPENDPLYFKASNLIPLGHTEHPIRAFCEHHERLLAFSEQGAWHLEKNSDTDTVSYHPVLHDIGCNRAGAVIRYENDVLLLNTSGFFRLHSSASDPDTFQISKTPLPHSKLVGREWIQNAKLFWEPWEDEIWIRDPSDTSGTVLIRSNLAKEWFFFDHIPASFFFYMDSHVGFAYEDRLCVFADETYADAGQSFTAYYKSGFLSFGSPDTVKRSARATLNCNTYSNLSYLNIETENATDVLILNGTADTNAPECFDRRLSLPRFRYLRFSLSISGKDPASLYSISFLTKP